MFYFANKHSEESMEEMRAFTFDLVRRTRPGLTESQARLVAEDLISRAGIGSTPTGKEEPFQFGARKGNLERKPLLHRRPRNKKPGASCNESTGSVFNNANENKKRHHKHCTACQVKTETQNKETAPKLNTSCGSLAKKKKSDGEDEETVEQTNETNVHNIKNVFERLYSLRKVTNVNKKNVTGLRLKDYSDKDKSSSKSNASLNECIGSVQKALDSLKLSVKDA